METQDKVINGQTWEAFCDALKATGQQILDNSEADELERAEGFRYLGRLAAGMLRRNLDPTPLTPPKIQYEVTRIGANNPDFLYGACTIRGDAVYRIRGRCNDAYTFNIGAYHGRLGTQEGLQCSGSLARADLEIDADGNFEIIASRERHAGNWLQLIDASNQLMVRQTILHPASDIPAELIPELLQGDLSRPLAPLTAAKLDQRLGMSALMLHGIVQQFVGWTNDFKQRPNEIHPLKEELAGLAKGDPKSQNDYGYFALAEDEVLLVKLQPPTCEYWNIQLANHWMESLDNTDIPSSINCATAEAAPDGAVYVPISLKDPGLPNWINTQGHLRGVIALRWVGAEPQGRPETKMINLADAGAGIPF